MAARHRRDARPSAPRETLADVLCAARDGGVLSRPGCVDYSIGKGVAPGVFVIVKPRHTPGWSSG